jgi:transposase
MPRIIRPFILEPSVKSHLESLSRSQTEEARLVFRSQLLLTLERTQSLLLTAQEHDVEENTVAKWRQRFTLFGIKGLQDAPRPGKPPKYGKPMIDRILATLENPPPPGLARWDGPTVAGQVGCSTDFVYEVFRANGIHLERQRSWCISTDKEFAAKAADVIGLYLNPPTNALVLSVDEKPQMQALERRTGYVQTSNGQVVRGLQSTYKRHGTLNLFGALEVATGAVYSKTTATKKRVDFLAYMEEIVAEFPKDREIHVILDNYCIHKKCDPWLAIHPNVTFHFTPTSASWLNLVEVFFGIFTRKALNGASFSSKEALRQQVEAFILRYNETCHPFVWKKREVKGSQLRNTLTNLTK